MIKTLAQYHEMLQPKINLNKYFLISS